MNIDNLTISQIKEILNQKNIELKDSEVSSPVYPPVIVRTYSAGAHFGYLVKREGQEVTLKNSRRIWSWSGALSLSEIASKGLDIKNSKVACPVNIVLTQAIEIIDCTPEAVKILEAARGI